MSLRNKFFTCVILYILVVAGYVLYSVAREERQIMGSVDEHLFLAAGAVPRMLADDFHDRALAPDSIGRDEELRNRRRLSDFAAGTSLEYVYTVVQYRDGFYFAAPSVTAEEAAQRESWYFYPYEDIPEAFVRSFHDGRWCAMCPTRTNGARSGPWSSP